MEGQHQEIGRQQELMGKICGVESGVVCPRISGWRANRKMLKGLDLRFLTHYGQSSAESTEEEEQNGKVGTNYKLQEL